MRPEYSKTELKAVEHNVYSSLESIQGLLRQFDKFSRSPSLSLARFEILTTMKNIERTLLSAAGYLEVAIKACEELDHAPVASIKRWLADENGNIRQATLEECAMSEGLTVAEYLAKEAEELAQPDEEYGIECTD